MAGPVAAFYEIEPWEEDRVRAAFPHLRLCFSPRPVAADAPDLRTDAAVLSVFIRSRVDAALLERLPSLRLVVTRSTGFDHIDLAACDARGIAVSNVPYYGESTVAEHTFALILALTRNVHKAYERTVRGDFRLEGLKGWDLKGRTLGVLGAGSIGLHVIRMARGFGMEVLAHDLNPNHLIAEVLGFTYVGLEELLRRSDIVSLHLPHTDATHHLINAERLALMKPGALLINTARGGLVDTAALVQALDEGRLGGAGLDVLEGEELIKEEEQLLASAAAEDTLRTLLQNHILMRRPNVVITPHIAFFSQEALERIVATSIDCVRGWLEGRPLNVVNRPNTASAT